MQYRRLGNSGLKLSAIGLGTNAFGKRADRETSISIIHAAIEQGVTFIDTANIYAGTQSETIIGEALKGKREQVILTTKAGLPAGQGVYDKGSSRRHLTEQLDASLKRLQTDHVDLFQIHTFDPETPLDETLRCLEHFMSAGKVRYIGCSNYYAWELMKALGISKELGISSYISHQTSYSLADRTPERELIPLCLDQGIGIIPYFPLAGGILTGKYAQGVPQGSRAETDPNFNRFLTDEALTLSKQVAELANELNTTPHALSIAWLLHQPVVSSVIVGATRVSQLEQNMQALDLKLDEPTLSRLDQISAAFKAKEPFAMYRI